MKILLEIEDQKTDFVLELLKNLKFVKVKALTPYKAEVFENIQQSIDEFNLVKEGKLKVISAKELLTNI
jgi:hypothetical protein